MKGVGISRVGRCRRKWMNEIQDSFGGHAKGKCWT